MDTLMTVCSAQEMSGLEGHGSYRKTPTHHQTDWETERDMHAHTGFNKALCQAHNTQTQLHMDRYW